MQVVYEDNHIIIVSKRSGEIVQGDKTGDEPLSETVKNILRTSTTNREMFSWVWYIALIAPLLGL